MTLGARALCELDAVLLVVLSQLALATVHDGDGSTKVLDGRALYRLDVDGVRDSFVYSMT